jgi:hypothetical protein
MAKDDVIMARRVFAADQVAAACDNFFRQREAKIEKKREKMIAETMKPKKYFFGLFTSKAKTREEAIEELKKPYDMFGSYWTDVELSGCKQATELRRLRAMAQHKAGLDNKITLSEKDWDNLDTWF